MAVPCPRQTRDLSDSFANDWVVIYPLRALLLGFRHLCQHARPPEQQVHPVHAATVVLGCPDRFPQSRRQYLGRAGWVAIEHPVSRLGPTRHPYRPQCSLRATAAATRVRQQGLTHLDHSPFHLLSHKPLRRGPQVPITAPGSPLSTSFLLHFHTGFFLSEPPPPLPDQRQPISTFRLVYLFFVFLSFFSSLYILIS